MTISLRRSRRFVILAACLSAVLAGCGDDDPASGDTGEGAVEVVAGFYPLAYAVDRVGGEAVRVSNLTNPGVEPHDLELSPRQVGEIVDADLVIFLGGFQPALDEAVEQNGAAHTLDVREVVPLDLPATKDGEEQQGDDHAEAGETTDPHMWLDPTKLAALATTVSETLAEIDPANATGYEQRAAALASELAALDSEISQGLANCARREFVTSHAAFGYLAARYDLVQIPISGISPEAEPSPARIQEIQAEVEEHGITTIFFETLVSPALAEAIARDTGATTDVLDPIEGIQDSTEDDYFTVMRRNLDALREALSCP